MHNAQQGCVQYKRRHNKAITVQKKATHSTQQGYVQHKRRLCRAHNKAMHSIQQGYVQYTTRLYIVTQTWKGLCKSQVYHEEKEVQLIKLHQRHALCKIHAESLLTLSHQLLAGVQFHAKTEKREKFDIDANRACSSEYRNVGADGITTTKCHNSNNHNR